MPRDLYAALGRPRTEAEVKVHGRGPDIPLPHDASPEEVEKAADAALFRHHPDRNPSDDGTCAPGTASARFRDAKVARDVLCDPARRAEYDAGRWVDPEDPVEYAGFGGEPAWHRAVTDPARRQVLGGFVEAVCVLGGLDQEVAGLASEAAMGVAVGAAELARSPESIAGRITAGLGAAAQKLSHPEGRAAIRDAGRSAREAYRKLFG